MRDTEFPDGVILSVLRHVPQRIAHEFVDLFRRQGAEVVAIDIGGSKSRLGSSTRRPSEQCPSQ
ncbi:hypothetical protein [Micromonospora echinofusca]|uniref:Uncharacterized protein n=1 Tax=Micromonospora echinofusca TaxID=47858 RepID=A0ABS3VJS3_MICEH|nr:hypothetical protein [Micromonospora echinofusca]MBO4204781.1 hypothetical protein [Micromonospora echinofusca]